MKRIKGILKIVLFFVGISLFSIIMADWLVTKSAQGNLYESATNLPHQKVGLLLGTSKRLAGGKENLYYTYRIEAAVKLFKLGKIDFILVSGDNSTKNYNEPSTIKNDLIARGIPSNKIYLDYAGFRTLDSIVRCKNIFGQDSITVISQKFHNERAVFLAHKKEITAIGFNAKDVNASYGFKTQLREKLARVKMIIDLIFGKQPKFLGPQIEIK